MAGEQSTGALPAMPENINPQGGSKGTATASPLGNQPSASTDSNTYSEMFASSPMPTTPAAGGKGGSSDASAVTTFIPPDTPLSPIVNDSISTQPLREHYGQGGGR